jgi:hypothetical protein
LKKLLQRGALGLSLVALLLVSFVWIGCGPESQDITGPSSVSISQHDDQLGGELHARLQPVFEAQNRHNERLMAIDNVLAVATTLDANGEPAIAIYTETELAKRGDLPYSIEGLPVITEAVGRIVAMKGGGGGGSNPRVIQTPPVKMGTSGGWRYDLANGYCCGGTLGSLIQIGSTKYVLSNWHVLYSDIVSGGNNRVASAGDPVIQPALIDVNCNANNAQNVATLVNNGGSLPSANVDAGIAAVISGMVDETGAILNIGTISSSTVAASLNQAVKKMGRTTGLSRSSVNGLNASVSIAYDNECAGGSAFTKTFTGQIFINNRGSKFLAGGDSGSLMVEDVTTNPRAVGLLYAGSSSIAVANPIGHVLNHYNASMVGN